MGLPWRPAVKALAYVIAVAAFCEGSARWFLSSETRFLKIASPYTEPSWRLRWILRQRTQGTFRYTFDVVHPTRGWALKPGVRDLEVFAGKRLNSNSRGLRGQAEFEGPKPPGCVRILVFGDSFTFGEDVSDSETYCHRLGGLLPGAQVLNFGVHGYAHDQMLLYLREEARRYAPDIVLLGYVGDDALRNWMDFRDFAKPRFRLRAGVLQLEGTPVPTPEQVLRAEPWRSKLVDLVTMLTQQAAWRSGTRQREVAELTIALLEAFVTDVRALGARPAIVDLPAWDELRQTALTLTPREQTLFDFCKAHDVPYLALRPLFQVEARQGLRLETKGHWGAGEHRVAAEAIADFLRTQGLLGAAATGL
jgi:GDSL-like Lipase/Acylhydrolase family